VKGKFKANQKLGDKHEFSQQSRWLVFSILRCALFYIFSG